MKFSSIGGRLRGSSLLSPLSLVLFLTFFAAPAGAQQVILQNDSIGDLSQAAVQAGFVADEWGAAWLTSGCDGTLSAVQVGWLSFLGGTGDTLGQAIRIWDPGVFPAPGSQITELLGPVLTDGFFNQYTVVPGIPVTNGQTVVVGFQFLANPPALGPSLVTDTDGCQASRNGIFAIPPSSWRDACLLGVSGDLALRAVVDCVGGPIFSDGFETGDTNEWSNAVANRVAPAVSPRLRLPVKRSRLAG